MEKILFVAAHPDDETLGAGGTIARYVDEGADVKVMILGTGMASREVKSQETTVENLKEHAKKAMSVLGVSDIEFYNFPDNQFDTVPLLKIVKTIENTVKTYKPDTVFTHHYGDLNIDHRVTFEAVLTACRPMASSIKKILSFEVPSSTECRFGHPSLFNPNYFIDISKTIKKKLSALEEYKTEMREFPHPRSPEFITSLATVRGGSVGLNAAEAFELVRQIL